MGFWVWLGHHVLGLENSAVVLEKWDISNSYL